MAEQRGSHTKFVDRYETFLDAAYHSPSNGGNDRWRLVHGVARELEARTVSTVLDCAAGTGFPAIELSDLLPHVRIHATDIDPAMLAIFEQRVKANGRHSIRHYMPPRRLHLGDDATSALRLGWHELSAITRTYDYVMCRGNSLAYGNTWSGGREVSSAEAVGAHLAEMAKRVRPGGYLHVDAPRRLELPKQCYRTTKVDGLTISEEVTNRDDCRHWRVRFEHPTGEIMEFDRYSALLTIADVKDLLDDLGFVDTDPLALYGERPGFGVIIAQKPNR